MKIAAIAGGVGGAKLAHGLAQVLAPQDLTVIVNTGDDFEHLGLKICPDLDTVCYTLAGLANPVTGWGRADETWQVIENLRALGGPAWFNIGDRDIATHLERTRRLLEGQPLSRITQDFCRAWGVQPRVLPMTDDPVATWVITDEGELPFQEYFVHRQCQPCVSGFRFAGAKDAQPAPGTIDAIDEADAVIFCPSNPWVSIAPVLAIAQLREAVSAKKVVAVSPIIGGKTLKGPAAKMFLELGIEPSAFNVARQYGGLLSGFVLDREDISQAEDVKRLGIAPLVTDTIMKSSGDRARLAREVLDFCAELVGR